MRFRKSVHPTTPFSAEALESRTLFAAGFSAKINFTTATGPNVTGYTRDYGGVYTPHKNGLTYGWNDDHQTDAYYAQSTAYNNPRVDSNIAFTYGDNWSIKVPNGYYTVHALMGQPGVVTGDQRLTAEGTIFVNGEPEKGFTIIEGFATVQVTDGKLTLATNSKARDPKLVSVEVTQVSEPQPTPIGNAIAWDTTSLKVPVQRVEFSVVRLGTKIYSLGGFTQDYTSTTQRFDVYDTKTLSFVTLKDLPGAPTHEAVATDGKYIYAAGGQFGPEKSTDLTAAVWRYDIANNKWTSFTRLPAVRTGGQLDYLNGQLHYIGGDDASRVRAQTTHWTLDLSVPNARWTVAAPIPKATDHFGTVVANGVIYAVGGENLHGISYLTNTGLYAYDPARDKWVTFASMPTGASHIEGSTFTDGKNLFVVGGQGNAQQLTNHVYVYNFKKNTWTESTPMPTGRKGGVAWLAGIKLYYLTGDDSVHGLQPGGYVGELIP